MPQLVTLYGLCVSSDGVVRGLPAPAGHPVDVNVVVGPTRADHAAAPVGELLAEEVFSADRWYRFVRQPPGDYLLRYEPVCDFLVSADLRDVVIHPVEGADMDFVSVLACGGLMAFILMMRGEPLLHASAVHVGDRAVAFVGRSGMGKSTIAALCCADGGRLVTDDVLRLSLPPEGAPLCYLGGAELRLRHGADEIGEQFDHRPTQRTTGDGRRALGPAPATEELLPLAAIVIPLPDRDAEALSLTRVDPLEGLFTLLSFPRITGWLDGPSQADQFQNVATVVERIPVYTCQVPWGPPFPPGIGTELLGALSLDDQFS